MSNLDNKWLDAEHLAAETAKNRKANLRKVKDEARKAERTKRQAKREHDLQVRKEADFAWTNKFKKQIEDAAKAGQFQTTLERSGTNAAGVMNLIAQDLRMHEFRVQEHSTYVEPEHSSGDSSSGELNHDGYTIFKLTVYWNKPA